jgi:hypothetical protein
MKCSKKSTVPVPCLTTRDKYLRLKYDITEATYKEMLAFGNGACWICRRKPLPGKNLNVDHEHLTKVQRKAGLTYGKVRGLLDYACNKYMIGRRKTEHADLFERAAVYLRSPKDWRQHDTAYNVSTTLVLPKC